MRRRGWLWSRRRDFHRLRSRARLYYQYALHGSKPKTSLLAVGTARVGSYLLTSYLHSLPDVSMRGEVLNPDAPQGLPYDPRHRATAVRHLRISVLSQAAPISGAKILLGQLERHGLMVADLHRVTPNRKFLIIYRRSLADQYVSTEIARRTGSWLLTEQGRPRRVSVHVDREDFRRYCDRIRRLYRDLLADSGVTERALILSYEDLAQDPGGVFRRAVCPFLDIPYHPVRTGFLRQNPSPINEKVSNFQDVADMLTGPEATQDYAL